MARGGVAGGAQRGELGRVAAGELGVLADPHGPAVRGQRRGETRIVKATEIRAGPAFPHAVQAEDPQPAVRFAPTGSP